MDRAGARADVLERNPCLSCGACCAFYRASFYWAEADDAGGTVPAALVEHLAGPYLVMRGTRSWPTRCVALMGDIGGSVRCSIHERRASVCREFEPSWKDGGQNPRCDEARAHHGLAPLEPGSWWHPEEPTPEKAA